MEPYQIRPKPATFERKAGGSVGKLKVEYNASSFFKK